MIWCQCKIVVNLLNTEFSNSKQSLQALLSDNNDEWSYPESLTDVHVTGVGVGGILQKTTCFCFLGVGGTHFSRRDLGVIFYLEVKVKRTKCDCSIFTAMPPCKRSNNYMPDITSIAFIYLITKVNVSYLDIRCKYLPSKQIFQMATKNNEPSWSRRKLKINEENQSMKIYGDLFFSENLNGSVPWTGLP